MKDRFRNILTTIIGAIILTIGITLFVVSKFKDFEFTSMELVLTLLLGWVFLTARNSLIEGIFLNLFKIKR